jgi:hypothetical protein
MGIMPHTDIEKALKLALSLDIPFWPQLPKVSFYEDMYAQALQNCKSKPPVVTVSVESMLVFLYFTVLIYLASLTLAWRDCLASLKAVYQVVPTEVAEDEMSN